MTITTPSSDGYVPPFGEACVFDVDMAIGSNALSLGGAQLGGPGGVGGSGTQFATGRFVVSGWNSYTNTSGSAETYTITQLASKIPAKLIFTIDGNEATLSFGGPTTTQTLTVNDGESVEGLTIACYY